MMRLIDPEDCDHEHLTSGFDEHDLERIEILRCPACTALYHPVKNEYGGETVLKRIPVERRQLVNLLECF